MVGSASAGFWDNNYSLLANRSPIAYQLGRSLHAPGLRAMKERVRAAIAAAAGQATVETRSRIAAPTAAPGTDNPLGGVRTIESVNVMRGDDGGGDASATVSAAQVTELTAIFDTFDRNLYVVDASGNGSSST